VALLDDLNNVTKTIWTSKSPYHANAWVGTIGDLFYNPTIGDLRISDGVTPGGRLVTVSGNNGGSANIGPAGPQGNTGPAGDTITSANVVNGILQLTLSSGNVVIVEGTVVGPPGPGLEDTFEVLSKNLKSYPYTINRDGAQTITSVVYTTPGNLIITKTLSYTNGLIANIAISGNALGNTYIKTLNYVDTVIVGASYETL
jgi:hypothetical protein